MGKIEKSDVHTLHYANELLAYIRMAIEKLYLFPAFDQFQFLLL